VPRYDGNDTFVLSGTILQPASAADDGSSRDARTLVGADGIEHQITRYRPIKETDFALIEKWVRTADGDTHWRVTDTRTVVSASRAAGFGR
jgi:hypothetical protein